MQFAHSRDVWKVGDIWEEGRVQLSLLGNGGRSI